MQDLRKWWSAGTECQYRREGIEFSVHALGKQILRELRFDNLETPIHQPETLVHPVHGATDITRTFLCDKIVEQGKSFHFAPSRIEERGAKDVHSLDIDRGFAGTCCSSCCSRLK